MLFETIFDVPQWLMLMPVLGIFGLLKNILGGGASKAPPPPTASPLEQGLTGSLSRKGVPALNTGLDSLMGLLNQQGRVDQGLFQRELREIGRGTEQQQQAFQGRMQRGNLQNSGAMNAIQASIGQAGQDRLGARRAKESSDVDARQRNNIMLVLQSILNPGTQLSAIDAQRQAGTFATQVGSANAHEAAQAQVLASIFGAIPSGGGGK